MKEITESNCPYGIDLDCPRCEKKDCICQHKDFRLGLLGVIKCECGYKFIEDNNPNL